MNALCRSCCLATFLALGPGCNKDLLDQAADAHSTDRVLAVHPGSGSMALRGDIQVQVALGSAAQGVEPDVQMTDGETNWTPDCSLDDDGTYAACHALELPLDAEYNLEIGIGRDPLRTYAMSAYSPEEGWAWMISQGATVTRLGGADATADSATTLVTGTDIVGTVLALDDDDEDTWFLAGLADPSGDDGVSIEEPGLTMAIPVTMAEDLRFRGGPINTFLPIFVDHVVVQTLIQQCEIQGTIEDDGSISDFSISGYLPASAVVRLAEPLGALSTLLLNSVELDEDMDGDGTEDAARFRMVVDASAVELASWNTTRPGDYDPECAGNAPEM